jgi:hypothetical protein
MAMALLLRNFLIVRKNLMLLAEDQYPLIMKNESLFIMKMDPFLQKVLFACMIQ